MELRVRNVNGALNLATQRLMMLRGMSQAKVRARGTETLEWLEPVTTIYSNPTERVLFSEARDANPFFHLFESLWMLAGRMDVDFVAAMVGRMASFSDNGWLMQGGYGWRWRQAFGVDQLAAIVNLLRQDAGSRRAVLAMWDVRHDMSTFSARRADGALEPVGGLNSKDIPCNTHIYFKARNGELRMTVCCRSNDLVWGAYGANVVQFSMLQEFVANKLGLSLGGMYQMSDSLHAYTEGGSSEIWKRLVAAAEGGDPQRNVETEYIADDRYARGLVKPYPLGARSEEWDVDLRDFFAAFDRDGVKVQDSLVYRTKWWQDVAIPLWNAWVTRDHDYLDDCAAEDWKYAGASWLRAHPGRKP